LDIDEPYVKDGPYIYKKIYLKALGRSLKTPDITVIAYKDYKEVANGFIGGKNVNTIKLNPPKDFCGVLARSLNVEEFQAAQYDLENNLIVIKISGYGANLEDFNIPFAKKQGIEDFDSSNLAYKMTYYAIIPAYHKNFRFSYFDLKRNRFAHYAHPIKVRDETVSTQSDIKPTEGGHKVLKIAIALSAGALFLIIFFFKRSWSIFFLSMASLLYGLYLLIPVKEVCIQKNAKVRLLPTQNSTIFFITTQSFKTKLLNSRNGYVKIELPNGKIGWVKNEHICKN